MNLRTLLSLPLTLTSLLTNRLQPLSKTIASIRPASTMVIESSKLNVLHGPLQPHTREGDSTHPTGFFRDGYCWGAEADAGKHYIGGVVTQDFLDFSKDRGNDLVTRRGGFPGLKDGCRWCLCVERWKEALMASERLGERVVPRVDLGSTALDALKTVKKEDLERFAVSRTQ
ncbi:hypothetical protein JCM24511_04387 [Saitozyma sp. JCM 24511]|nr:hypothetical protein JCM24511_04387 [Saitozyma sp. JCM 24511]